MTEKEKALRAIEKREAGLANLSDEIWDAAETAFKEYKSAELLCTALEAEEFEVTRNVASIETAFTGRFGSGKPVIGVIGEYDALYGLSQEANIAEKKPSVKDGNGHGCGHNLLGAGSLAAAIAVKEYLKQTQSPGTVIYFGCPAEEGGSGKTFMAREGVFDGVDCALTWHPSNLNAIGSGGTLSNIQVTYRFYGISAHAAISPHQGRSALDAVELMNVGVNYLREHIIPEARVHYAVTNSGGKSPNVVQSYAEVLYLIRAPKMNQLQDIFNRVSDIAAGAALMTGTHVEKEIRKACSNIVPNCVLENLLYANMKALPMPEYTQEEQKFAHLIKESVEADPRDLDTLSLEYEKEERDYIRAHLNDAIRNFVLPYKHSEQVQAMSSDVGDVSWKCPTAQIFTASWAANTPVHSWQAVSQGKGSIAHKSLCYAGKIIAAAIIDLFQDPQLIDKAKAELDERLDGAKYVSPIPNGVNPKAID